MALTPKQKRMRAMDAPFSGLLGAELVTNGYFFGDPKNNWTLGVGFAWSEAKRNVQCDGEVSDMTQTLTLVDGANYFLQFYTYGVVNTPASWTVTLGGGTPIEINTGEGSHTLTIKAGAGSDLKFSVLAVDAFIGSIDDISLKKIL